MLNKLRKLLFTHRENLTGRTLIAASWSLIGSSGRGLLRLMSNLILTRLLFPEAFGLMATAMVIVNLIQLFSDTGIKTALIQNPRGGSPEFINTSFIISIIRNMLLFIILIFAIQPVVSFYQQEALRPLLWIMAFALLVEGFQNPGLPIVIKKMQIEKQVLYSVGSQFAGFVCTIILVYNFRSVTAVAVGYLLTSIFRVIASYLIISYRPQLKWDRQSGLELLHFGKFVFVNTMVGWMILNLDRLVLAKTLDMNQLGYYNIALYIGVFLSDILIQIFSQSYFPALSMIANQPEKVHQSFHKALHSIIPVVVPILTLTALFSNEIILVLYDPRYSFAAGVLFWLSLKSIINVITDIQSGTIFALGKPVYVTISNTVGLIILVAFLPYVSRNYGIQGTGSILLISSITITIIQSLILSLKLKFPVKLVVMPWIHISGLTMTICLSYMLMKPLLNNPGTINLIHILPMVGISIGMALFCLNRFGSFKLKKLMYEGVV